mmetsp:Transcript_22420/g.47138  ORF Transcript_22420/g.47138 Transcript_22420/m.47138 type:complete len:239 (-) Transcript_22420:320-1036(-)
MMTATTITTILTITAMTPLRAPSPSSTWERTTTTPPGTTKTCASSSIPSNASDAPTISTSSGPTSRDIDIVIRSTTNSSIGIGGRETVLTTISRNSWRFCPPRERFSIGRSSRCGTSTARSGSNGSMRGIRRGLRGSTAREATVTIMTMTTTTTMTRTIPTRNQKNPKGIHGAITSAPGKHSSTMISIAMIPTMKRQGKISSNTITIAFCIIGTFERHRFVPGRIYSVCSAGLAMVVR